MNSGRALPMIIVQLLVAVAPAFAEVNMPGAASSVDRATMGQIRLRSTLHSIGIEWDMQGDANHNAACQVRYRRQGGETWHEALNLLRIDYRGWYYGGKQQAFRAFNMLAGSILFLETGADYEIELAMQDPDGGDERRSVQFSTRPEPEPGPRQRTWHVVPGQGGGDGSETRPFQGIHEAQKIAQPGDTFLLHAGQYQSATLATGGTRNAYVLWKPAGDGEVVINNHLGVEQGWTWIEGFTFVQSDDNNAGGVFVHNHGVPHVVVKANTFRDCSYALSNKPKVWSGDEAELSTGWYFADNIVAGGPRTLYGTRAYALADSDVCYNQITTTHNGKGGDAVSLRFSVGVDVYHNDMRDLDDDGIEPDYSYANMRFYHNRIVNPRWHGLSFQPMLCSPWYLVGNEFVLMMEDRRARPFKTNVFDRTVQVNNTFVVRARYGQPRADLLLRAYSRNNLWVHVYDNPDHATNPTGALWLGAGDAKEQEFVVAGQALPDWKTDVDHDGFAWTGEGAGEHPFWWEGVKPERFRTLEELAAAVGIERHGHALDANEIFVASDWPAYAQQAWSIEPLILKPNGRAIDIGVMVPNLRETFTGEGPDLGPHESGAAPVHYGPRTNLAR